MRNLLLTGLLMTFLVIGFGQNEVKLLRKAYRKSDTTQLLQFFQNWQQAIPALSESEWSDLSDLHKEAYLAFSAFYRPDSIGLTGGSEFGNDIYKDAQFLLVQNSLDIYLTDIIHNPEEEREAYVIQLINERIKEDSTREALLKRDEQGKLYEYVLDMFALGNFMSRDGRREKVSSITNFRPGIKALHQQALYLNEEYSNILYAFLGNKYSRLGKGGMVKPARAKKKSLKRQAFLENHIRIWQGHWGGYWQLPSYPVAESITFDQNRTTARVDFRMIYEGGEAILKKENGHWEIVTAYLTWIE
jgi:hypothetical protein